MDSPWKPVNYTKHQAALIQALSEGRADEDQQIAVLRFIIENICNTYDMSFRPGAEGDRETVFAEGKRFVGNQIIKLTKLNLSSMKETS